MLYEIVVTTKAIVVVVLLKKIRVFHLIIKKTQKLFLKNRFTPLLETTFRKILFKKGIIPQKK